MSVVNLQELLPEWNRRISRKDFVATLQSPVCARHFYPEDIITHDVYIIDNQEHRHQRGKPKLAPTAIPKIFDGPKYRTVPPTMKRKFRDRNQGSDGYAKKKGRKEAPSTSSSSSPVKGQKFRNSFPVVEGDFSFPATSDLEQAIDASNPQERSEEMEVALTLLELSGRNTGGTRKETAQGFDMHEFHSKAALKIKLPATFWAVHSNDKRTCFAHIDENLDVDKCVEFCESLTPKVYFHKKMVEMGTLNTFDEVEKLLKRVDVTRLCIGYSDEDNRNPKRATKCTGHVPFGETLTKIRCLPCEYQRRSIQKTKKRNNLAKEKMRQRNKTKSQKVRRLKKKVITLKQELDAVKTQMSKISKTTMDEMIKSLSEEHQELVKACVNAARHPSKGRRYTTKWVYDCLKMRMKAPGLYSKMQKENSLPLPSESTLNRAMKRLRPIYGFDENAFKILAEKLAPLSEYHRHGTLKLDEMALQENISFDRESLKVHGLVDLGKFTKEEDKDKRGDHGLVCMIQPFQGNWVQAVGAFLSAGAVHGDVLHHIIIEAIILLERSGFGVDAVVTDGATWNRAMWDFFGISKDQPSCVHPVDPKRQLHMISDFCHLIKNLWARICNKKYLVLLEGTVKIDHWQAVLDEDKKRGVKRAHTVTQDMLNPTNFQKMNVGMAMRFFGHTMAAAMESYKNDGVLGLQDSSPSIEFIKRINAVIQAMNSQQPIDGLKADPLSRHNKTLTDFLDYLDKMEVMALKRVQREREEKDLALQKAKLAKQKAAGQKTSPQPTKNKTFKPVNVAVGFAVDAKGPAMHKHEFSTSTFVGLYVTVQSALRIIEYLSREFHYSYLLTRRLNQDALEHFFGNVRSACGSGSHPDPKLFIQLYRLLSTYSLMKPPRGSNVPGSELLQSIIELEDIVGEENLKRREEIEEKIDIILDGGIPEFHASLNDHSYLDRQIDPQAITVLAGYVSRKMRRMQPAKDCQTCFNAVCAPSEEPACEREAFLTLKSHGGLLRPSEDIFSLVFKMEDTVNRMTSNTPPHSDMFIGLVDALMLQTEMPFVGCEKHQRSLTSAVIIFYLTCRMHFVCREANQMVADKKRAKADLRKKSKL